MADRPTRQLIDLVKLVADHKNPRLPRVADSSRAALLGVVRTQRDKIVEMAVDIASMGLSPGEALYVMPSEDGDDFVVLEGNRRFTALKLLQDPTLADGGHISASGVRRLHEAARSATIPEQVECVVFATRDAAAPWLERRHTGEREGAGLVRWGSVERARFEFERTGVKSPGLAVLDYVLENAPSLDAAVRENAEEAFALTNLERVLLDVKAQPRLGVAVSGGRAVTTLYGQRLLIVLTKLVSDVATWLKVSDIDNEKLRGEYLDRIRDFLPTTSTPHTAERLIELVPATEAEPPPPGATGGPSGGPPGGTPPGGTPPGGTPPGGTPPPGGSGPGVPPAGGSGPGPGPGGGGTGPSGGPGAGPRGPRPKGTSRDRKNAFPRGTKLYIKNRRVNDIFIELSKISLEKFPNSAAVLFRVMLELSADYLIQVEPDAAPFDKKAGAPIKRPKLWEKLLSTIAFLDKEGFLPPKYAEVAQHASTAEYGETSTRAMNINVHNIHAAPTPEDVKNAWDEFEHYVRGIWKLVAERH